MTIEGSMESGLIGSVGDDNKTPILTKEGYRGFARRGGSLPRETKNHAVRRSRPFVRRGVCSLGLLLIVCCALLTAQMARKPSPSNEPAGVMDKKPDSKKNSLLTVMSEADFNSIARVYHPNTPYALPHAMFVIDRRSQNKIYFVNSQRFRFHKDFLLATYLVPRGADVFKPIYIDEDRRFIVGTIAWQKPVEKYTWELWEGDLASAEHIATANEAINKHFFAPVAYKPNSLRQEDVSRALKIDRVLQTELNKNQEYLALNTGK